MRETGEGGAPGVESYALSVAGKGRAMNEDDYAAEPLEPGFLLAVADGVGGAPLGEEASALALITVQRFLRRRLPAGADAAGLAELLAGAVRAADLRLRTHGRFHPEKEGMGTTLTTGFVAWPHLAIAHVGDSRAYLFRKGRLVRLTSDHTIEQHLAAMHGRPVASSSRWRNFLWNVVGGGDHPPRPEFVRCRLEAGDLVLLTTDGLTNALPDEAIEKRLSADGPAVAICRDLVGAAQRSGAEDDVTLVVARFGDGAFPRRAAVLE